MKKSNGEGSLTFKMRNNRKYYTAQISVGRDENGKLIRKSKSSYTKREVVDWMNNELAKATLFNVSKSANWTLGELIRHWLFDVYLGTVKPNSFYRMEAVFRKHVLGTRTAQIQLKNLNDLNIEMYFKSIKDSVSSRTYNDIYYKLKTIFDYAKSLGAINTDLLKSIKTKKIQKKEKNVWTADEQQKIINALEDTPVDNLILLDFASGLRLGEVLALTWDDLKNGILNINKQWQRQKIIHEDGTYEYINKVDDPKTQSSHRQVPLPSSIASYFEERRDTGIIFKGSVNGYICRRTPSDRLKTLQSKLGIPYRNFHTIRHAYATRLFEKGIDPKTVQKLLGHSTIKPSMEIYTHVVSDQKTIASEVLNGFFNK